MKHMKKISTLPERLEEAMQQTGKKQADLVAATGLSHSTVSRYASGLMEPRQEAVIKLATALGVSEWWLYGYDVPQTRTAGQKKNDDLVQVIAKLRTDPNFFDLVSIFAELPADQYDSLKVLLTALRQRK